MELILDIQNTKYQNTWNLYLCEGNQLSEYEPDIYHLDIGGGGEGLGHADEEGGQHKQRGQVYCNLRLKEKGLEVVCGVDNAKDEDGGKVGSQELIHDPPVHCNLQINSLIWITYTIENVVIYYALKDIHVLTRVPELKRPFGDDVLDKDSVTLHEDLARDQVDCRPL